MTGNSGNFRGSLHRHRIPSPLLMSWPHSYLLPLRWRWPRILQRHTARRIPQLPHRRPQIHPRTPFLQRNHTFPRRPHPPWQVHFSLQKTHPYLSSDPSPEEPTTSVHLNTLKTNFRLSDTFAFRTWERLPFPPHHHHHGRSSPQIHQPSPTPILSLIQPTKDYALSVSLPFHPSFSKPITMSPRYSDNTTSKSPTHQPLPSATSSPRRRPHRPLNSLLTPSIRYPVHNAPSSIPDRPTDP